MRKMECGGCGCTVRFEISDDPYGKAEEVANDPVAFFYCVVCSSAEPSEEEVHLVQP